MRLNNEGKPTSKLWLVGGAVGAVALAAAASLIAGTPRDAGNAAANAAKPADTHEHSEGDGHDHSEGDGHDHGEEAAAKATATPAASPTPAKPTPAKPAAGKTTVKPAGAAKVTYVQGMKIEDLRVGTGPEAQNGKSVAVDYRGTLTDGTVFDESYKRKQTFDFTLPGGVIEGWNLGLLGMKEGGKRRLTIPPALGYGPGGQGPIPPNATLIFEIELRKVS